MRILIEHIREEELQVITERLKGFSWRVLPDEIILYEPYFELEGMPEEGPATPSVNPDANPESRGRELNPIKPVF